MLSQNIQNSPVNDFRNCSENKYKLKNEFLIYLEQENILEDLQLAAVQYEKSVGSSFKKLNFIPPFRFKLKTDLMKLQEISEQLHLLFMREVKAALELAQTVIFYGLPWVFSNIRLNKSDLQIVPIVINLPITREISDLLQYPSFGLESVQGVLMSKTTVANYVRSSVYSCELNECPRNMGQRLTQNPGIVCPDCLNLMKEDVSSTDTGDEVVCQFIPLKAYQSLGRFQVLNVTVRDELCLMTNLEIGEEYKITGILNDCLIFEAMNIQTKEPGLDFFCFSSFTLPDSIQNLYQEISELMPNCSWAFVYALASTLASHLIPTSAYLHLKMGLLLSLCTQKNNEIPVPLLAVGADSLNVQHLFHTAGKLAKRYVRHSTAHSYLGGAAKPGLQSDVLWLEAGQLILAATGICNLGDWSKFKKEQASYICQTIETRQIVLNKCDMGKTDLIDFIPLKCAVWTYWCHITTSRCHQSQLKTLINVFGIPFLADEKNEKEIRKICWKNLEKAMKIPQNDTLTGTIPFEDLKELIEQLNSRELILSDPASQLISNYFVVSRQERPYCLPLGAVKTITSLAEAHARLALRNEVLYDDVVAIIYLYEEAISTVFGESMNSFPKLNWNEEEPIYVYMEKQLQHFKNWLDGYLSI